MFDFSELRALQVVNEETLVWAKTGSEPPALREAKVEVVRVSTVDDPRLKRRKAAVSDAPAATSSILGDPVPFMGSILGAPAPLSAPVPPDVVPPLINLPPLPIPEEAPKSKPPPPPPPPAPPLPTSAMFFELEEGQVVSSPSDLIASAVPLAVVPAAVHGKDEVPFSAKRGREEVMQSGVYVAGNIRLGDDGLPIRRLIAVDNLLVEQSSGGVDPRGARSTRPRVQAFLPVVDFKPL